MLKLEQKSLCIFSVVKVFYHHISIIELLTRQAIDMINGLVVDNECTVTDVIRRVMMSDRVPLSSPVEACENVSSPSVLRTKTTATTGNISPSATLITKMKVPPSESNEVFFYVRLHFFIFFSCVEHIC